MPLPHRCPNATRSGPDARPVAGLLDASAPRPVYSTFVTPHDEPRYSETLMRSTLCTALGAGLLLAACREAPITTLGTPSFSALGAGSATVVNVSRDTTAQNETPLAVNPANPSNMIAGNNDWNYNDGCGVNATFDGGKTW